MSDYKKFQDEFSYWRKAHHLVSKAAGDEVVDGRAGIELIRLSNQIWRLVGAYTLVIAAYCFDQESHPVSYKQAHRWLADELPKFMINGSLDCVLDILRAGVKGALTCEEYEDELLKMEVD